VLAISAAVVAIGAPAAMLPVTHDGPIGTDPCESWTLLPVALSNDRSRSCPVIGRRSGSAVVRGGPSYAMRGYSQSGRVRSSRALRRPRPSETFDLTQRVRCDCLHHRRLLRPLEATAGALVTIVEQGAHVALVEGCR
jgi:hypothetical protein